MTYKKPYKPIDRTYEAKLIELAHELGDEFTSKRFSEYIVSHGLRKPKEIKQFLERNGYKRIKGLFYRRVQ